MDIRALLATELGTGVIFGRMLLAVILGAVIGFDREYLDRPAGLRTHVLVCLAAATFSVLTLELFAFLERTSEATVSADPIRIIEAVTAGVAFLAAGSIIMSGGKVHGLTTGAGLWLAGAVGTACGVGAYTIAILATVLGVITLVAFRAIERLMPKKRNGPSSDD